MNNTLSIMHDNNKTYVCLFDELGQLIECHPYSELSASLVGNIYIGVVKNKIKGIGGYFVDFGSDKNGFLPIHKNSNMLSPGQSVVVQVEKDAYGTKGAKLTTNISLHGEYAVLVTDSTDIHFSSKLKEDERTKGIKSIFKNFTSKDYGFIVRTNAYDAENSRIKSEIETLCAHYQRLMDIKEYRPNYTKLYNANLGWMKYVQNINKSLVEIIDTQTAEDKKVIEEYIKEMGLHNNITVNLKGDLYRITDLGNLLQKALKRKIWLPSGASLIIDKTEAMYVIDVNSDKNISKRNNQKNILKINLEAAKEVAKQLRLRNLSGIILVDFIDLDFKEDQEMLLSRLETMLSADPVRTILHGLTSLGIVEITRKRLEPSLEETLNK